MADEDDGARYRRILGDRQTPETPSTAERAERLTRKEPKQFANDSERYAYILGHRKEEQQ